MLSEEAKDEIKALVRGAYEPAVVEATEQATQNVARVHRRRLVTYGFLAGLLSAALISIPVVLIVTHNSERSTEANIHRNCESQSIARPQGNARAYAQIAFLSLVQDVFSSPGSRSPQGQAFLAGEQKKLEALAAKWRPYTAVYETIHGKRVLVGNELPAKVTGYGELAQRIRPVPLIDCTRVVRE